MPLIDVSAVFLTMLNGWKLLGERFLLLAASE